MNLNEKKIKIYELILHYDGGQKRFSTFKVNGNKVQLTTRDDANKQKEFLLNKYNNELGYKNVTIEVQEIERSTPEN